MGPRAGRRPTVARARPEPTAGAKLAASPRAPNWRPTGAIVAPGVGRAPGARLTRITMAHDDRRVSPSDGQVGAPVFAANKSGRPSAGGETLLKTAKPLDPIKARGRPRAIETHPNRSGAPIVWRAPTLDTIQKSGPGRAPKSRRNWAAGCHQAGSGPRVRLAGVRLAGVRLAEPGEPPLCNGLLLAARAPRLAQKLLRNTGARAGSNLKAARWQCEPPAQFIGRKYDNGALGVITLAILGHLSGVR